MQADYADVFVEWAELERLRAIEQAARAYVEASYSLCCDKEDCECMPRAFERLMLAVDGATEDG